MVRRGVILHKMTILQLIRAYYNYYIQRHNITVGTTTNVIKYVLISFIYFIEQKM